MNFPELSMMRLLTHLNVGAVFALVAWFAELQARAGG